MTAKSFDFQSIREQKKDISQIRKTFAKAIQSQKSANKLLASDSEGSFTLAYEAMLKASLALMFSRGFRPRVKLGHHKTLINFSSYVLGEDFSKIMATYDRMRDKRNKIIYDTNVVSGTEAKHAVEFSIKYLKAVANKIAEENPQLRLF